MAVLNTGPIINDIRGKVGDVVFSRNQGGAICYAVPVGVDPNTADQQAARSAITNLSAAWSGTLDEAQRNTWRRYAGQHPRPDRWGQPRAISGYLMFTSINAYWYRDAQAINWLTAPTRPPLHLPTHTLTADAAADTATIALPPTNYDPPPAGLILWHFAGYPRAGGVGFHRTPYRFTEKNTNTPGWTTTPWTLAWPWAFEPGQKLFSHLVAQDLFTGALSTLHQTSCIAT